MVKAIELRRKPTEKLLDDIEIYFRVLREREDIDRERFLSLIGEGLEILNRLMS